MSYSVYLPNYSIGENCYKGTSIRRKKLWKKAVVIGGKTAMEKQKMRSWKASRGSDLEITDFIWYGGDSSYENGNALIANPAVRNADIIFGVGGGRACDTAKYVANELDKPLFTFPTVASNCAAVTAICVIYNANGFSGNIIIRSLLIIPSSIPLLLRILLTTSSGPESATHSPKNVRLFFQQR